MKNGIRLAIVTMSFVQMGANGIAPILADLAQAFPAASASTIQFLMTMPSFVIILATLAAARLSTVVPKKRLVQAGTMLVMAVGVLGFSFHDSLTLLFLWGILLGVGIGLVVPIATSLVSDYFDGTERAAVMGQQTAGANIGAMLMTALGGMLAAVSWQYNYLVYLLALPGFLFATFYLPNQTPSQVIQQKQEKLPIMIWYYGWIALVFTMLFNVGPVNLAMLMGEAGIGGTSWAGFATAALLLGGAITGYGFGSLVRRLRWLTIPCGFFLLAAGNSIIIQSQSMMVLLIGTCLCGGSIGFVMPRCMMQVSALNNPALIAMAVALVMAGSNLGGFLTPILTSGSALLFATEKTAARFLLAVILAGVSGIIVSFSERRRG